MKGETAKNCNFHFVSDLHLGSGEEPNFLLFKEYLSSLPEKKVTHLFMLGDIFDLWVADQKFFIEKYKTIVDEIKTLVDQGIEVHYFEGNHDFHLKKFWENDIGVYVYEGPQRLEIDGLRFLLAHGDQIDKEDIGYIRLRKFFRSSFTKFIAFNLPSIVTRWVGGYADKKSQGHYLRENQDNSRIFRLIRNFAEESYQQLEFDFCITGHFHVKDEYRVSESSKAINLGTWLDEPSFYSIDIKGSQFNIL